MSILPYHVQDRQTLIIHDNVTLAHMVKNRKKVHCLLKLLEMGFFTTLISARNLL